MNSDAHESSRTIEWLAWFEVNKIKLLVVLIALIVLGAAVALYRAKVNADEVAAWAALFRVEKPSSRDDPSSAPTPQALMQVASSYRGTDAGAQALLLSGQAWFEQGKFAEAREQLQNFVGRFADSEFAPAAALGVAACLDSENKPSEALAAYQRVASQHPNTSVGSQAKLASARIYESRNEPAQALKIYDELTRATAQSLWSADAGMRRELLLTAHPELAPTNQTAVMPAATPVAVATNVIKVGSTNRSGTPPAKP